MANNEPMPEYLKEKRSELIWALVSQDYNGSQLAQMFNISRSNAHKIIKSMPEGWVSPWRKVR